MSSRAAPAEPHRGTPQDAASRRDSLPEGEGRQEDGAHGKGERQPDASPLSRMLPFLSRDVHLFHAPTAADAGACAGFVLSLVAAAGRSGAIVWISHAYLEREGGALYGPGLQDFAIDPDRVLHVNAPSLKDVFWSLEEALKAHAVAAVVGEFHTKRPLHLTPTRRLALRSARTGVPVYLLAAASAPFASAAQTHWTVSTPAAAGEGLADHVGPPVWRLDVHKNKKCPCSTFSAGFDTLSRTHFTPVPQGAAAHGRDAAAPAGPVAAQGSLAPVVVRLAAERRRTAERLMERR